MTGPDLPIARVNLAVSEFPITIEARSVETGGVVWSRVVHGPEALYVPPLAKMIGHPVRIRIRYPDGTITDSDPPS
jgi:hypothetical protein